jgi:hypothetical protein
MVTSAHRMEVEEGTDGHANVPPSGAAAAAPLAGATMKNYIKMLHELTNHVPKESTEGDNSRSPYKLLHAGINVTPQRTRVRRTQAWKTSNNHQNC